MLHWERPGDFMTSMSRRGFERNTVDERIDGVSNAFSINRLIILLSIG